MVLMSLIPESDICRVLGIGVADQFVLGRGAVYSLRTDRVLLFSTPDLVTDMTLNEYARRG